MPLLHVVSADADDALLVRIAGAVAEAAGLEPGQVLVDRIAVRVLDGDGLEAEWGSVLIQGRDRGPEVTDAVAAAVREAWGDDRVSVAWVFDR